jgi:hypothetical protein
LFPYHPHVDLFPILHDPSVHHSTSLTLCPLHPGLFPVCRLLARHGITLCLNLINHRSPFRTRACETLSLFGLHKLLCPLPSPLWFKALPDDASSPQRHVLIRRLTYTHTHSTSERHCCTFLASQGNIWASVGDIRHLFSSPSEMLRCMMPAKGSSVPGPPLQV